MEEEYKALTMLGEKTMKLKVMLVINKRKLEIIKTFSDEDQTGVRILNGMNDLLNLLISDISNIKEETNE